MLWNKLVVLIILAIYHLIYLSTHHLPIQPCIFLPIHLSTYSPTRHPLPTHPSIYPSTIHAIIHHLFIIPSINPSTHSPIYPFIYLLTY